MARLGLAVARSDPLMGRDDRAGTWPRDAEPVPFGVPSYGDPVCPLEGPRLLERGRLSCPGLTDTHRGPSRYQDDTPITWLRKAMLLRADLSGHRRYSPTASTTTKKRVVHYS